MHLSIFLFFAFSLSLCFGIVVVEDGEKIKMGLDQIETVEQQMGSTLWVDLPLLEPSAYYELRISYPATNPTLFIMEVKGNEVETQNHRSLLNTEKIMFSTDAKRMIDGKEKITVSITALNDGVSPLKDFENRSVTYDIVLESLFFGLPFPLFRIIALCVFSGIVLYIMSDKIWEVLVIVPKKKEKTKEKK